MTKVTLDEQTAKAMQAAMQLLSQNNIDGAKAAIQKGLERGGSPIFLNEFIGLMLCRAGAFQEGAVHLRAAYDLSPGNTERARNLATAFIAAQSYDAVIQLCEPDLATADATGHLWRFRGFALQELARFDEAADAYQRVVDAFPEDFEAWNNLGNALASNGAHAEGVVALRRALSLQPNNAPVTLNCAASLVQSNMIDEAEEILANQLAHDSEDYRVIVEIAAIKKMQGDDAAALRFLRQAVSVQPENPDLWLKLGTELQTIFQTDEAEEVLRKALVLDPKLDDAYLLLGLLYEHTNQPEAMRALLTEAERFVPSSDVVGFIRSMVLWRDKSYEAGFEALEKVSSVLDPVRTTQLRGQFLDRLGRYDDAFEQFARVNELHKDDPSRPLEKAQEYRLALQQSHELATEKWFASWSAPYPHKGRSPVFLVGFPRSGTTLLDTLLMGHPDVEVLEERPTIKAVEVALGATERLASLTPLDIEELREVYFSEARRWTSGQPGKLLVDKSPLYLNKLPQILRLFPDARFILALRHPMDVLLSCYVTNFRLNPAMSNFLSLDAAAELYDATFTFWEQCVELLKPSIFTLRYEKLIQDKTAEVKPLFEWLGLDWQDGVLDHQKTARERGMITTASYSQVTEPIYLRSKGRWEAYRNHLEPLLPKIAPWAARFGYDV